MTLTLATSCTALPSEGDSFVWGGLALRLS